MEKVNENRKASELCINGELEDAVGMMKELGVECINAETGEFRDAASILTEMSIALADPESDCKQKWYEKILDKIERCFKSLWR